MCPGEGEHPQGVFNTPDGRIVKAKHTFTLVRQDPGKGPEKRVKDYVCMRKPGNPPEDIVLAVQVSPPPPPYPSNCTRMPFFR